MQRCITQTLLLFLGACSRPVGRCLRLLQEQQTPFLHLYLPCCSEMPPTPSLTHAPAHPSPPPHLAACGVDPRNIALRGKAGPAPGGGRAGKWAGQREQAKTGRPSARSHARFHTSKCRPGGKPLGGSPVRKGRAHWSPRQRGAGLAHWVYTLSCSTGGGNWPNFISQERSSKLGSVQQKRGWKARDASPCKRSAWHGRPLGVRNAALGPCAMRARRGSRLGSRPLSTRPCVPEKSCPAGLAFTPRSLVQPSPAQPSAAQPSPAQRGAAVRTHGQRQPKGLGEKLLGGQLAHVDAHCAGRGPAGWWGGRVAEKQGAALGEEMALQAECGHCSPAQPRPDVQLSERVKRGLPTEAGAANGGQQGSKAARLQQRHSLPTQPEFSR